MELDASSRSASRPLCCGLASIAGSGYRRAGKQAGSLADRLELALDQEARAQRGSNPSVPGSKQETVDHAGRHHDSFRADNGVARSSVAAVALPWRSLGSVQALLNCRWSVDLPVVRGLRDHLLDVQHLRPGLAASP